MRSLPLLALLAACTDVNFSPLENTPPELLILSHRDGDHVLEGYGFEITGSVLDNRGTDGVVVNWIAGDDTQCSAPPDAAGRTACEIVPLIVGALRVRLEGTDTDGAVGFALVNLVVDASEPPVADITRPIGTARYYSNTPVPLEAVLSDAEDAPSALTYTWSSDVAGALPASEPPSADGRIAGSALLAEGPHTLTLTATDGSGKTGADTVSITVGGPNTAPTCDLVAPLDGSESGQWNEIVLAGLAQDADVAADALTVTFESDRDGDLGAVVPSINGDVQLAHAALSLGEHTLTLRVVDDAGATCTDAITHTVVEPPTAPVVEVTPEAPESIDDLVCDIAVPSTDPQGDPLTYTFEWTTDGVAYVGPTLTTLRPDDTVPNASTGPGQVWECAARATDGGTTSAPGLDAVTIATPGVSHIVAGKNHSCLLDTNTWLECWGDLNNNIQDLEGGYFLDVALGNNHTCGIELDGEVSCVGINAVGQIDTSALVGTFTAIDAGDEFTCAIDDTRGIQCWGSNVEGQTDTSALLDDYVAVTAGFQHACAITDASEAVCWGSDVYGRSTPPVGVDFVQISAGTTHTCGIDTNGEPHCFGRNTDGQTMPPANVTFADVSAGDGVSCGVAGSPGPLHCWGRDTDPALGGINAPPFGDFWSVYVGGGHQCAVDALFAPVCWGENPHGEATPPLVWW